MTTKMGEDHTAAIIEITQMLQKGKSRLECKSQFKNSVLAAARGILPEVDQGRGLLHLILSKKDYLNIPGVKELVTEPTDPGIMPVTGKSISFQVWNMQRAVYIRTITGKIALRRALIKANNTGTDIWAALAAKDEIMGIDGVDLRTMYETALRYYGDLSQNDLIEVRSHMLQPWDCRSEPIQAPLDRLRQGIIQFQMMDQPLHIPQQLQLLWDVIRPVHPNFAISITHFLMQQEKDKTATFEEAATCMIEAWTVIQNQDPQAKATASATANAAIRTPTSSGHIHDPTVTLTQVALQQLLNDAVATALKQHQQGGNIRATGASVPGGKPSITPNKYCWTHGLGFHDGTECKTQGPGHQHGPTITLANAKQHGGSEVTRPPRRHK